MSTLPYSRPGTALAPVAGARGVSLPRRALDIAVAGTLLVALAPLLLLIAGAVLLSSRGPVLHRQVRIGQGGRPFVLLKFRSMRCGEVGPSVTRRGDPRITRVGAVLRLTSLDELPQLLNVLRGQMTLVGPRPETPGLAARYPAECRWVFAHRPGITGPCQLRLRDREVLPTAAADPEEFYLTELVPQRVAADAEFLADPSLGRTLRTLAATAAYLLHP